MRIYKHTFSEWASIALMDRKLSDKCLRVYLYLLEVCTDCDFKELNLDLVKENVRYSKFTIKYCLYVLKKRKYICTPPNRKYSVWLLKPGFTRDISDDNFWYPSNHKPHNKPDEYNYVLSKRVNTENYTRGRGIELI